VAYGNPMRLAVLGLGQMGRAFAARALRQGHEVTVWNRTPGRAGELVDHGAVEATSPAEAVVGVEAALVVVADDTATMEVSLGEGGAMAALGPVAVLATVSTVSPETARALAESGPDGRVVDSPVMGSPAAIERGEGRFLVGGPTEAVARLDALWRDLGAGYVHCGAVGAGATMKVLSNLLLITGVTALAEAIATARARGIGDDLLRTVLGESMVVSAAAKLRLEPLLDDDHPGWFSPELARKDIRLATGLAGEAGVPARIGPVTDELLSGVIDGGGDWQDFAAVIEALRPGRDR
jgi:3-hydroxyisobutyrate dehydrogenase-like beta-hydroxyacid dehydrogenase